MSTDLTKTFLSILLLPLLIGVGLTGIGLTGVGLAGTGLANAAVQNTINEADYFIIVQTEYWRASPSGTLFNKPSQQYSLSNLGTEEDQTSVELRIEHPLRYIPKIRIVTYNIEYHHPFRLDSDLMIGNQVFTSQTSIASEIDLSHVEITTYFDLLKEGISIQLGLSAKKIDGELALRSATNQFYFKKINETLPLISVFSQVDLPAPGWQIEYLFTGASFHSDQSLDIKSKISYQYKDFLSFFIGYRRFRLKITGEENFAIDINSKGPFLGIHFLL